jgi:hypothetical protein
MTPDSKLLQHLQFPVCLFFSPEKEERGGRGEGDESRSKSDPRACYCVHRNVCGSGDRVFFIFLLSTYFETKFTLGVVRWIALATK